jgi:hypothetical protein
MKNSLICLGYPIGESVFNVVGLEVLFALRSIDTNLGQFGSTASSRLIIPSKGPVAVLALRHESHH